MQVLLLTDVKKVGQRGSVVDVADGYAQNVLIPKKLARPATKEVLRQVENLAKVKQAEEHALVERIKKLFSHVDGKTVEIVSRMNDAGVLFEAIHERQICDAIRAAFHVEISPDALHIEDPIKKAGQYEVRLRERGCQAKLYVSVHK